jgi:hypothetical protein
MSILILGIADNALLETNFTNYFMNSSLISWEFTAVYMILISFTIAEILYNFSKNFHKNSKTALL